MYHGPHRETKITNRGWCFTNCNIFLHNVSQLSLHFKDGASYVVTFLGHCKELRAEFKPLYASVLRFACFELEQRFGKTVVYVSSPCGLYKVLEFLAEIPIRYVS